MIHWEIGELKTRVIIIIVLAKESRKKGLRNCFLHLGELVIDILDDSLDKLPFLLQRFLQSRIGSLRVVLSRGGQLPR
jgi:hypothetical protein